MPPGPERDADDLESFHRWLSSTAHSEGMSKEELINEMLSYYWIVDELSKTVGKGPDSPGIADGSDDVIRNESQMRSRSPEDPSNRGSVENETQAPADQGSQEPSSDRLLEEFSDDVERLDRLVRSLQQLPEGFDTIGDLASNPAGEQSDAMASADASTFDARSVAEEFATLEERVEELQDRQETALQTVQTAVGALEHRQAQTARQAADDGALSEVTAVQEEIVDELSAISDRLDDATRRHRTLATSHQQLEDRIEAEFDDLESILTHLLETVKQLDTQLDEAITSHGADLKMLKYQLEKRHHLGELKREANLQGVETAECSNCGVTCHLGLLETPFCPDCGEQFASIEATWLPFKNATLQNGGPLKR